MNNRQNFTEQVPDSFGNTAKTNGKKHRSGIARRLILVFISIFLGVTIYLWNAKSLAGNSLPMPFGCGVSVILSGSMEPALSVNDVVFIRSAKTYNVGDIVVYQSGRELIIHRITEINGDKIVTRGDANNISDAPVDISDVKGRLCGKIPYAGAAVRVLKSPAVIFLTLAAAFLLLELSYRRDKSKDLDEIEKIKEEIKNLKESQENSEK